MTLSITQRIHLTILLGEKKGNVSLIRSCSKIMDKIELSEEEKAACELGPTPEGGLRWNDKSEPRDFDLSAEEKAVIKAAINDGAFQARDLYWLEPILESLP